ncbi:hypothetical protein MAR_015648 [Mya arenaria]|uniref:Uncharacterized protein n=1 Tax=Mya arenaria TaxID=6604 RepID=A0ABY7FK09_MYAAR|nr:hypothetical protein MAR_015648 [Mya arenaria]
MLTSFLHVNSTDVFDKPTNAQILERHPTSIRKENNNNNNNNSILRMYTSIALNTREIKIRGKQRKSMAGADPGTDVRGDLTWGMQPASNPQSIKATAVTTRYLAVRSIEKRTDKIASNIEQACP